MEKILYHVWKVDSCHRLEVEHERVIPEKTQFRVIQNELPYKGIYKVVKSREIWVIMGTGANSNQAITILMPEKRRERVITKIRKVKTWCMLEMYYWNTLLMELFISFQFDVYISSIHQVWNVYLNVYLPWKQQWHSMKGNSLLEAAPQAKSQGNKDSDLTLLTANLLMGFPFGQNLPEARRNPTEIVPTDEFSIANSKKEGGSTGGNWAIPGTE